MSIVMFNKICLHYKNMFILCLLCCCGCNKKLDVTSTRVDGEANHWQSYEDVHSGLIALYGLMRAALAEDNAYWLYGDLREGDFTAVSRPDLKAIISGNLNASYTTVQTLSDWTRFYAVINACNLFIERSGEALQDARYTELNHKVDLAQAHVMRSFVYFYMARIWGDVPLITQSHDGDFVALPKSTQEKVLDFTENDIISYINDLPYVYGVADDPILPGNYYGYNHDRYYNSLLCRVNAYIILAHIAAWREHYDDANVYSKYVLDNYSKIGAAYATAITDVTDAGALFYERDARQMLAFTFIEAFGEEGVSGIGHIESLTLATPLVSKRKPDIYVDRETINNVFTNSNDTRFGIDTLSGLKRTAYFTNYDAEIPIFSKIKVINTSTAQGQFAIYGSALVISRLEEITLLRSEALAVLGLRSDAITLLNIIRKNRGLPNFTDGDGDLIDAIFDERRRELMGEGWRWYDLVRYNRIKRKDPAFNALLDNGGIYWPIAKSVLGANPLLVQNSYWK